jgi:WD40 repeat protein
VAHDVFISYSSKDKTIADAACATLERDGIRCWIAPRDVLAGQTWAGAIVEAIEEARVFVLILSSHSNASLDVSVEVEHAIRGGLTVIPFRIDDVTPSGDMSYYLRKIHWLDALTPPLERHLEALSNRVSALIGKPAATSPIVAPVPPAGRFRRIWGVAIAIAISLAALLVFTAPRIWQKPATSDKFAQTASPIKAEASLAEDPAVAKLLRVLIGKGPTVGAVAISPDLKSVVVSAQDLTVQFHDRATGAVQRVISAKATGNPFDDRPFSLLQFSLSGDRLIGARGRGFITCWETRSGREVWTSNNSGYVHSMSVARDMKVLATAGATETKQNVTMASAVGLVDAVTGQPKLTVAEVKGYVRSLAFSPGGTALAGGQQRGHFSLWNVGNGAIEWSGETEVTSWRSRSHPTDRPLRLVD